MRKHAFLVSLRVCCPWQSGSVPRRSGVAGAPRDYVAEKGIWPLGPFLENVPIAVLYAARIAVNLEDAITARGMSKTAAAAAIGVARPTLYDVIGGITFPDLNTLARAEDALDTRLWPNGDRNVVTA